LKISECSTDGVPIVHSEQDAKDVFAKSLPSHPPGGPGCRF
jgi:hypothetical protein